MFPFPLESPPPHPTPSRLSQSTRLGSLCYNSCLLVIYFTHDTVYMPVLLSQEQPSPWTRNRPENHSGRSTGVKSQ